MAVEARRLHVFHPRFLPSREVMNPVQGNGGINDTQMGLVGFPLWDAQIPMYSSGNGSINLAAGSSFVPQAVNPAIPSMDSSVTSNVNNNDLLLIPRSSRKRTREECTTNPLISQASYVHHQQIEIDQLISHHMEIVKKKIEETRDREGRMLQP